MPGGVFDLLLQNGFFFKGLNKCQSIILMDQLQRWFVYPNFTIVLACAYWDLQLLQVY